MQLNANRARMTNLPRIVLRENLSSEYDSTSSARLTSSDLGFINEPGSLFRGLYDSLVLFISASARNRGEISLYGKKHKS